jgi:hypothetical protein
VSETSETSITPTIEQELDAIKAVLEALVKLPDKQAQSRVLRHAHNYLGLGPTY